MRTEDRYLGVVQLGQARAGVRQQEVAAQDGHFVPKLHVLERTVGQRPLLQVDDAAVHQEGRVDQLGDLCQVPLARRHGDRTGVFGQKARTKICSQRHRPSASEELAITSTNI